MPRAPGRTIATWPSEQPGTYTVNRFRGYTMVAQLYKNGTEQIEESSLASQSFIKTKQSQHGYFATLHLGIGC